MDYKNMKDFSAAVDVSLIRRKFYHDGPGAENWDWWVRGERFDSQAGYQLIVDQGDGNLSRVPVTVDGSDVTFGDMVLVTEEYPDKAVAAAAVIAGMAMFDPDMVLHASRADTDDRPVKSTQEGASAMDEATRKYLAASLRLPEDATEEQINAKIKASDEAPESGKPAREVKPGDEPPAHQTPPGTAPSGTSPSGSDDDAKPEDEVAPTPDDLEDDPDLEAGKPVVLDAAAYRHLKAGADAAIAATKASDKTRREAKVAAAISAGKFPPARKSHYIKLMAADEEGTTSLLDSLEPGLIPVDARGTGGSGSDGEETDVNAGVGLPDTWFPEIAAKRDASNQPRPVMNAREG